MGDLVVNVLQVVVDLAQVGVCLVFVCGEVGDGVPGAAEVAVGLADLVVDVDAAALDRLFELADADDHLLVAVVVVGGALAQVFAEEVELAEVAAQLLELELFALELFEALADDGELLVFGGGWRLAVGQVVAGQVAALAGGAGDVAVEVEVSAAAALALDFGHKHDVSAVAGGQLGLVGLWPLQRGWCCC